MSALLVVELDELAVLGSTETVRIGEKISGECRCVNGQRADETERTGTLEHASSIDQSRPNSESLDAIWSREGPEKEEEWTLIMAGTATQGLGHLDSRILRPCSQSGTHLLNMTTMLPWPIFRDLGPQER